MLGSREGIFVDEDVMLPKWLGCQALDQFSKAGVIGNMGQRKPCFSQETFRFSSPGWWQKRRGLRQVFRKRCTEGIGSLASFETESNERWLLSNQIKKRLPLALLSRGVHLIHEFSQGKAPSLEIEGLFSYFLQTFRTEMHLSKQPSERSPCRACRNPNESEGRRKVVSTKARDRAAHSPTIFTSTRFRRRPSNSA